MREPREKVILLHIQEDIHDILLFTHDLDFIKFKGDNLVKKAVCMSLLNIGELVPSDLSRTHETEHDFP